MNQYDESKAAKAAGMSLNQWREAQKKPKKRKAEKPEGDQEPTEAEKAE